VNSLVAGRFVDPTWSMITTSERPLITQDYTTGYVSS